MKHAKYLIYSMLLVSLNTFAAEQTTTAPAPERDPKASGTYSWQQCVDDHMNESGLSQEKAYEKCRSLQ